ncbi:MAG: hypothetical protein KatS3mg129_1265 [Leptospiraceae bacterium]|nr:MAG: hypothetical protein KatS3mg129_1265 [Leptospiraceae bacterium]
MKKFKHFLKKNGVFLFFLFLSFCLINPYSNIKKIAYEYFLFENRCFKEDLIPNFKWFKKSPIRTTLLEPDCNEIKKIEFYFPMVVDGVSIVSSIFIKTDCIFDKNKVPLKVISYNPYFILWDSNKNKFHSLWVQYIEKSNCGFVIIPEEKLNESSNYLFLFNIKAFYYFLKKDYRNNYKELWYNFKEEYRIKDLDKKEEELLVNLIELYSNIYYFNPDENIYTIFPVRSYSGIFAPFLYFRELRKQVEIDILEIKNINQEIKTINSNVYKVTYKENKANQIKIFYTGIDNNNYSLAYYYKNNLVIYIPDNLKQDGLNILITNGDIISLPFFQGLAKETNSILINYYVFKDRYLNLINDIFIYDNLNRLLNRFVSNYRINQIYKICFYDIECIISTFYEDKIKNILVYKIPEYIIDAYKSGFYYDANININTIYKFNFTMEEIENLFLTQLKEDIFRIYLYRENKEKLDSYLNYSFTIHKIHFLFNKNDYNIINYRQ